VDVRLGHRDHAQSFVGGDLQVPFDVAHGIDDDGVSGSLAPDEIRVLGEPGIVYLAEIQGRHLAGRARAA
jgi:hypothetical protein